MRNLQAEAPNSLIDVENAQTINRFWNKTKKKKTEETRDEFWQFYSHWR